MSLIDPRPLINEVKEAPQWLSENLPKVEKFVADRLRQLGNVVKDIPVVKEAPQWLSVNLPEVGKFVSDRLRQLREDLKQAKFPPGS